jgi:hypothetical protein
MHTKAYYLTLRFASESLLSILCAQHLIIQIHVYYVHVIMQIESMIVTTIY